MVEVNDRVMVLLGQQAVEGALLSRHWVWGYFMVTYAEPCSVVGAVK